jgi:E3 ubiquitin-protein ligase RAD18
MKLRQNWAVGELVEAFKQARPEILEFVKLSTARRDSPKRTLDEVEDVASPVQKRTRSGRRIQSSSRVIVPEQFDDDGDSINGMYVWLRS